MLKEEALRELGTELRSMRKDMCMTLEELAAELGTDFRVISRYEKGQAEMGTLMYRKLVKLHEQKTKQSDLLQQIRKLSATDQIAVEMIISSLSAR